MTNAARIAAPAPDAADPLAAARACSFDALVQPLGQSAFVGRHLGRSAWRHVARTPRFAPLLTWERLNSLIRDQPDAGPRLRLVKAGLVLPESAWHRTASTLRGPLRRVDTERLLAQLRGGASIVWDAIDQVDEPLRLLRQAVERALGGFVFVNLYAGFGAVHGFPAHWDDHDVFVLQLAGRKRWRVHPPTRPWPLPNDAMSTPPARYAHDWTLHAGSVLYLPRGWWHRVTPLGEPTLHLTIGLLRPNNLDLLRWLAEQCAGLDLVRQDVPALDTRAARTTHSRALRVALGRVVTADGIEAYARHVAASSTLEPRPSLQAVAAADPRRWNPQARVVLASAHARLDVRGGGCKLHVAGGVWQMPAPAREPMGVLAAGGSVGLAALVEAAGADGVGELVSAGVLALE